MSRRRIFCAFIFFSFLTINVSAQSIDKELFPPIGIEQPPISPYFPNHNIIRKNMTNYGYPKNKDATRFLEKAVKENNSVNVEKLLKAGASGFINYEMIDKKQYEIMELMYKDNPRLIRYSQLLHYACAKSDTKMIDFLMERNASLDLYGCYFEYGNNSAIYGYFKKCEWNKDEDYRYTPADCALFYQNWNNLNHIINKYHKYPTIYGCNQLFGVSLMNDKQGSGGLKMICEFLSGNDSKFQFMKSVDYTMSDVINFGYHYVANNRLKSYFLMSGTIQKIADSRRARNGRDKEYIDLLNLMIAKGANMNPQDDRGAGWRARQSVGINVDYYVNTTPMYIAVTNPGMLDIVKLLLSKGASMTTTVNGQKASIATLPKVLDEYKEYFMLEGIQ